MTQQLLARGRMGSYALTQGRKEHFYVPTPLGDELTPKGVSDNLNDIHSTMLNFYEKMKAEMSVVNDELAKLKAFEPFPIGSVYIAVDNVNPRDKFGYGNWQLTSGGRALVGAGGGKVLGQTGGSATVSLALAHMPAHKHDVTVNNLNGSKVTTTNGGNKTTSTAGAHTHSGYYGSGGNTGFPVITPVVEKAGTQLASTSSITSMTTDGAHSHTINIDHNHSIDLTHGHTANETSKGSGAAFNIENPFFVVNVWYRVS